MQLGNEVIVKNFHVLESDTAAYATAKDGKIYFKINKYSGTYGSGETVGDTLVTTDQFCLESIKRVRLTKPTSCVFKKWEISMPDIYVAADAEASPAVVGVDGIKPGTLLTVYMHYTNLYGFGITDSWEKYATVAFKSGMTAAQLAWDMAVQINAQYIKDKQPVKATAYNNSVALSSRPAAGTASVSPKIVIEDMTYLQQTPTRRRLEMNMEPQPIQMYLTTNLVTKYHKSDPTLNEDGWQWCTQVREKAENVDADGYPRPLKYDGIKDTEKVYKNDYLIWGLEKVSQLNSTEHMADPCTGFIGYDSVMDNESLNSSNYWVLDIAYETLPKMGVPSGRNLKELSFACVTATQNAADYDASTNPNVAEVPPAKLTNLLATLGLTGSNQWDTDATPDAYLGYKIEPLVSSAAMDAHIVSTVTGSSAVDAHIKEVGDTLYKPLE